MVSTAPEEGREMSESPGKSLVIGVVGLGYVGLPLAEAFAQYFTVFGFDVNT